MLKDKISGLYYAYHMLNLGGFPAWICLQSSCLSKQPQILKRIVIVHTLQLFCFSIFASDCIVDSGDLKRFLN